MTLPPDRPLTSPVSPSQPRPAWMAVAKAEFRTIGTAVRFEMIALAAVLVVLTIVLGANRAHQGPGEKGWVPFLMIYHAFPAFVAGFLAPLFIWKHEEPAQRAYLWSMPVDRRTLTLTRVLAGWCWLMAVVMGFLVWALLIARFTGGPIGLSMAQAQRVAQASALNDPASLFDLTLAGHLWMWLVPFAAATVTYLAGSAIAVACNHAWRWFAGLLLTLVLLYGIEAETGLRVWSSTAFGRNGFLRLCLFETPDASDWLTTLALWTSMTGAALLLAVGRHRES